MDFFPIALTWTLAWEGGYSNNPADPGGATNFGITQRTYDSWLRARGLRHAGVDHILQSEVKAIYREDYWVAAHCHEMPPEVARVHFDTAVNFGPGAAAKMLQRTLNRLEEVERTGRPRLAEDGDIGNRTLTRVESWPPQRLAQAYCRTRLMRRDELVQRNGRLAAFLKGWKRRDNALLKIVGG